MKDFDLLILTPEKFIQRYCLSQDIMPYELAAILRKQKETLCPTGWMMLECQVMDSNYLGSLTILPYGGEATYKELPTHPISPRGLASDTSTICAILLSKDLV